MTALARYLQRTSRRNVIIIGAPGVGKTALVEGLARELGEENVPDFLRSLRIIQIQATDFLSATKGPDDMEQRAQAVLAEAAADPDMVLFFDEIHLMVVPDVRGGLPPNLINIIRPALISGKHRCIGTATTAEFERYLKNDAALIRQFQVLPLEELPEPEIIQICREWAQRIESAQQVKFEEDAILAAVTMSARLAQDRALPEKAIELLENAATFVKVASLPFNSPPSDQDSFIKREDIMQILQEQDGLIEFE
jgi:ATP-dependent Clp protease ATP-binding subunit ClpA